MINLEIKPKQSWVLILMLVILLGGMLGTIILVFRNALNGDRQLA
jgi:LPS O-antigen subunit length determinant protein (WzzB/FepE family)